jgi:3-deoxy-7-phosphoheptulonate synthase
MEQTHNLRVDQIEALTSPDELKRALPLTERAARFVSQTRREIEAVLAGEDSRVLAIVGPCSIHDPAAALEYAERLASLRARLSSELLVCMRVYFEKPRTSVGWKGLINDPHLDGSCDVGAGLSLARKLLLSLAELGMPAATETLDPVAPQYLADLVSWTAIGARTTESQTHREMASGLSMPVGFKNGTDGGLQIAINAMQSARAAHSFIGIDGAGHVGVVRTRGNPHTHLVLRGGRARPNYCAGDVDGASDALRTAGLNPRVLVDCSHDNSGKNHENQPQVLADIARQLESKASRVLGVMLESNLVAGRQQLVAGQPLVYGQSITDGCMDFATTEALLYRLAATRSGSKRAATSSPLATQKIAS